jgi:membrane-bound inhibitor of C-type lysozyme
MYKKTLLILGLIVFFCGAVTIFIVTRDTPTVVESQVTAPTTSVTYVSAETNETITVRYAEGAILNGAGYREVSFLPVEAASGAKYESKETNLTLWSKGNEVTLSRGRQILFVGTDANQDSFQENNWESVPVDTAAESPDQATSSEPEVISAESETAIATSSEAAAGQ